MNKAILIGRLTKDPETRQGETTVSKFTLAVNRAYAKTSPSTDFISCVAFGKTAEFIDKYIKQGTKIAVEGHIQTGSYTNKEGAKVYTTDVVIDSVEFAESKKADVAPSVGSGWIKPEDVEEVAGTLPFK